MARNDVNRYQAECQSLQGDIQANNQRNAFLTDTQRQLERQKETEAGRSLDLNNDLQAAESKFIQLDTELTGLGRELEAVRSSNEQLLETGHCFKQELHALQNHADILALQNNDLQKELDEFVLTDDMVKTGLDRKDRVFNMKQKLENSVHASRILVDRSRSPQKSQSRSPLRTMTNQQHMTQQPQLGAAGNGSLAQAYLRNKMQGYDQQSQSVVHHNQNFSLRENSNDRRSMQQSNSVCMGLNN